eukprot:XP_001704096.1 Hypothetical protein GL50803_7436 [Giardia lamblia ATCC 50803]
MLHDPMRHGGAAYVPEAHKKDLHGLLGGKGKISHKDVNLSHFNNVNQIAFGA